MEVLHTPLDNGGNSGNRTDGDRDFLRKSGPRFVRLHCNSLHRRLSSLFDVRLKGLHTLVLQSVSRNKAQDLRGLFRHLVGDALLEGDHGLLNLKSSVSSSLCKFLRVLDVLNQNNEFILEFLILLVKIFDFPLGP